MDSDFSYICIVDVSIRGYVSSPRCTTTLLESEYLT